MTETRMCAFPPLGKPVQTTLTDRSYRVTTPTLQANYSTLPDAWDRARVEAADGEFPQVWAVFGFRNTVLMADWRNTY